MYEEYLWGVLMIGLLSAGNLGLIARIKKSRDAHLPVLLLALTVDAILAVGLLDVNAEQAILWLLQLGRGQIGSESILRDVPGQLARLAGMIGLAGAAGLLTLVVSLKVTGSQRERMR